MLALRARRLVLVPDATVSQTPAPPHAVGCAAWLRAHAPRAVGVAPSVLVTAAVSGFGVLALEVLWTRMLAQVLHNSVYSFSAILGMVLVGLALGSLLAAGLRGRNETVTLPLLLLLTALLAGLSPTVFSVCTGGLTYFSPRAGFPEYLARLAGLLATVILPSIVLAGTIFPVLGERSEAAPGDHTGRVVGMLVAANTLGGIVGSLTAGFLLLPQLGLWASLRTLAVVYAAGALAWTPRGSRIGPLSVGVLLLLVTGLDPVRMPAVRLDPDRQESVYASRESALGLVSVVRSGGEREIKVDTTYALGGTGALEYEQTQADLPLVLASAPKSGFFLGLGTGITAGAALRHPLESLVVAELIPDVILAARDHFAAWNNGLFTDPRAHVVAGDGRLLLRGSADRYDVIVSDLFIPWHAGTGSLFTREHFAELDREDFLLIARTMLDIFPDVTLWRGDFLPDEPIVALVGRMAPRPLDPREILANVRRLPGRAGASDREVLALTGVMYAGNLGAARDLVGAGPLHTDDRPLLEYRAPIAQREKGAGRRSWFVGESYAEFLDDLARRVPADRDPAVVALGPDARRAFGAGLALYRAVLALAAGDRDRALLHAGCFAAAVPHSVYSLFRDRLGDLY